MSPPDKLTTNQLGRLIYEIRGQRVMLDSDLTSIYNVSTKRLLEQVRRNLDRFPHDSVFQITRKEQEVLRSQIATLKTGRGQHRKDLSWAFTEHGAIMAANALNSQRAVHMSVFVVRAFLKMRALLGDKRELARKLAALEKELKQPLERARSSHRHDLAARDGHHRPARIAAIAVQTANWLSALIPVFYLRYWTFGVRCSLGFPPNSSFCLLPMTSFAQFEHEGWERVADKYDSVWSTSTRQFIPPLLEAAGVAEKMSILDVGCGPGYVSAAAAERGALPTGLDFSQEMIAIAQKMFPRIEFCEGDAQNLPLADASFDRVLANFALLHLADPERACAEACRVLKPGGKFGFTVWAPATESPYAKIIDDAIATHANMDVDLPEGPPHHLYAGREEFRQALERAGFDGASLVFKLHTIEWHVPSARFIFDAEHHAGVRTAGLLARQAPEKLRAIQSAIENAVRPYAKGDGFAIPKAAYVVAVSKS